MSKNTNQNQNPVKKAEPQLAKDTKSNVTQNNTNQQPQKNDGKSTTQQPVKAGEPNKNGQQQQQPQTQQQKQQPKQQQQPQQQQQQQQQPSSKQAPAVISTATVSKQQQEQAKQALIDKQNEEARAQKKLLKKQKKQEYLKLQKQYFDSLYRSMQSENLQELVEGKQTIDKVDNTNVKKIQYGIQSIEGLLFRKGNMIEEDQVDSQLLEAFKERDALQQQILSITTTIQDCEDQLVDIPKTIYTAKKPNIVEEALIEKRILDYKRQKIDLEAKLKSVEKNIKNLQSQRIDNPRSAYSHAGLKAYIESQEQQKIREASVFVKKVQEDKKIFDEKMKKIESEQQAKEIEEEQARLAKEARQKIIQEKEKEEQLKKRIKEIKQEKLARVKDLEQHEEQYKEKKEKMNNGKSQQKLEELEKQKNMDEIKETHKRIDEMNLFDHQQKYLDKLKAQEEERLAEKKKRALEMKEHLSKVSSFPSSAMWSQSKEEVTFNSPQDQKIRAQKIVEARNHFAEGVKKKKVVHIDKQKKLEIEIKIDKMNNPSKYIRPQRKRRNSNDSQFENSEDYDKFDEKVFKNEIKIERGKNNHIDKGKEYLEEVKEVAKRMSKKAHSEQPLSRQEKITDNISEIKNNQSVMSNFALNTSQMKSKIDYMHEIRSKFNLDKKTNGLKDWERISKSSNGIDPFEKKKSLLRISKKLDDEAKHQELMYSIQKNKNKSGIFTLEDVQNREKIDEIYLESIKAKLAIFDSYHQTSPKTNLTQPEHSRDYSVLSQQ